jgi:hypothetical protein
MPVDQKLLEQATNNPANIWFEDAVKLAEQMGWIEAGGSGSHRVFRHPKAALIRGLFPRPLNLQRGKDGKAKAYQVRQLLEMAREMGIIK